MAKIVDWDYVAPMTEAQKKCLKGLGLKSKTTRDYTKEMARMVIEQLLALQNMKREKHETNLS